MKLHLIEERPITDKETPIMREFKKVMHGLKINMYSTNNF